MSIRILLAEDQVLVRQSIRWMLETVPDMTVVADASDGREAVELARRTAPDVVLMDVNMPELNGASATRLIAAEAGRGGPRVIALSTYSDRSMISRMLEAGASGYILKTCDFETLVEAIRTVKAGRSYLSPEAASVVLESYVSGRPRLDGQEAMLTGREQEVLQLVAEGRSSKEIAQALDLSVRTVEAHRRSLMRKLQVKNVAGLVQFAMREKLAWDNAS